jgi:ABC-type transport system involved in cytochrome c biogenesis permease subunit
MLVAAATAWMVALVPLAARAQTPPAHHHEAASGSAWHLMQDSVAFLTFNHQGGSRGGRDFGSQNWWMGMAERPVGTGTLRFNLMLSLDPATVGK